MSAESISLFAKVGKYRNYQLVLILCCCIIVIFIIDPCNVLKTINNSKNRLTRSNINYNRNVNIANVISNASNNSLSVNISSSVDDDQTKAKKYYEKQSSARRSLLGRASWGAIYGGLVPEIICPLAMRVGRVGDGGKWICNPFQLPDKCHIYSLGINSEISFEDDLQLLTNKRCHITAIDSVQQNPNIINRLVEINGEFHQILLDGPNVYANPNPSAEQQNMLALQQRQKLLAEKQQELQRQLQQLVKNNGTTTLTNLIATATVMSTVTTKFTVTDLLHKFGHTNTTIELLKMDIEGAEQTALPSFLDQRASINSYFCQIFIEMHQIADLVIRLFKSFAKHDYYLFAFEINEGSFTACEFSFMHKSCFDRYGIKIVYSRIFPNY